MGSRKTVTSGYKIRLGFHLGWMHGVPDKLIKLSADDRTLWAGAAEDEQTLTVDKEGLFGGDTREGGMAGPVHYQPGKPDQTANAYLLSAMSAECPGYRGIVGTVFENFYIGTSTYLKKISGKFQRIFLTDEDEPQWYLEKAAIPSSDVDSELQPWLIANDPRSPSNAHQYRYGSGSWRDTIEEAITDSGFSSYRFDHLQGWSLDGVELYGAFGGVPGSSESLFLHFNAYASGGSYRAELPALSAIDTVCGPFAAAGEVPYGPRFWWTGLDSNGSRPGVGAGPAPGGVYRLVLGSDTSDPGEEIGNNCTISYGSTGGYFPTVFYCSDVLLEVRRIAAPILDMNPSHIIREALTNAEWGLGEPDGDMGESFTDAADQLYSEDFGLSIFWDRQTPIEDFIEQVRKHIDAALYVEPTTGKYELKLIRDDYDVEDLVVLDESNVASVTDYSQRQPDELVNAVVLKYESNATDKEASIEVQDIAQIQTQGAIVSTTVNYPGIGNAELAGRVASRELRALSQPLISCSLDVEPVTGRALRIGQPFVMTWPDYGVDAVVMRVVGMSLGDGIKNNVKVTAVQDVFSTPAVSYVTAAKSDWADISTDPEPVDFSLLFEAPYYLLARELGQSTVDTQLEEDKLIGLVCAAALRPIGAINCVLSTDAGAGYQEIADPFSFCPCCTLDAGIGQDDEVWAVTGESGLTTLAAGDYGQIDDELVKVVSSTSTTVTVKRGMLDTVPAVHASGSRLFVWSRGSGQDPTSYATGEEVLVKLQPVTGRGTLAIEAAGELTITLAHRAIRPYPPGNIKINGQAYPVSLSDVVTVTWSHRDRTQQTGDVLIEQDDGDIGPEVGTTYNVRVLDADTNDVLSDASGIVGTSYEIASDVLASSTSVRVQVWSTRVDSAAAALGAANDILTGTPELRHRFLLAGGGRVDIVFSTTMFGDFYTANRYSSAGALEATLNCRTLYSVSFDATAGRIAMSTHATPTSDATLWIIDVAAAGLTKVDITPDFPSPSGFERVSVAAAGGFIFAVNYDGSRVIKYDEDGVELLQEDVTVSRVFAADGTRLVFSDTGGISIYDVTDLSHVDDVTFSPSVTQISPHVLIGEEVVFLDDTGDPGFGTLYRYDITTGALIDSYADVPYSIGVRPAMSFFTPYLVPGDNPVGKVIYDTTDWTLVAGGGVGTLESWQRQERTFGYAGETYSAWSETDKDSDVSLSNSNRTATIVSSGTQDGSIRGTQSRNASGDHSFSVTMAGANDGRFCAGIGTASASITQACPGIDNLSYGYFAFNGFSYFNNTGTDHSWATSVPTDVLTFRLNAGALTVYRNGSLLGTIATGLTGDWFPMWGPGSALAGTHEAVLDTSSSQPHLPSGSTPWG